MTDIKPLTQTNFSANASSGSNVHSKQDTDAFNQKVLELFESEPEADQTKSSIALRAIWPKLAQLANENGNLGMQQIANAMVYADLQMKKEPEHAKYESSLMYKMTNQVMGLNMYYTSVMYNMLSDDPDAYPTKLI